MKNMISNDSYEYVTTQNFRKKIKIILENTSKLIQELNLLTLSIEGKGIELSGRIVPQEAILGVKNSLKFLNQSIYSL